MEISLPENRARCLYGAPVTPVALRRRLKMMKHAMMRTSVKNPTTVPTIIGHVGFLDGEELPGGGGLGGVGGGLGGKGGMGGGLGGKGGVGGVGGTGGGLND